MLVPSLIHLRNDDRNIIFFAAIIASLLTLLVFSFSELSTFLARMLTKRRVSVAIVALLKGLLSDAVGGRWQVVDLGECDEPVQALLDT